MSIHKTIQPTHRSSVYKMIAFKLRRVKVPQDPQTLTHNKTEGGKASEVSSLLQLPVNLEANFTSLPPAPRKSDQWFLPFASVITTSAYFQTFTFLCSTPVLMNQNLLGRMDTEGQDAGVCFIYLFFCKLFQLS